MLNKLAQNSACNYIKLLNEINKAAEVIEAYTIPLAYDFEGKTGISLRMKKLPKATCLFTYVIANRLLRKLVKKLFGKNIRNYYSQISKILCIYGLEEIAEKHDKRFVRHILYPLPQIMKQVYDLL